MRRGWLASPLDTRRQHCGQSNHACARTHEHRAGSLCTKSSNNNNGGFSGFLKVGVEVNSLKFSGTHFLGTFTCAAAYAAFWLALPSSPKSLVFRARFSFEFFQCPVAAHAFPNAATAM